MRTHLNRERSRRRRAETVEADLSEAAFEQALASWRPAPTPEEVLAREQLRDSLRHALSELSADLRMVVWMADVEGFSHRELAEMLCIPEGTVASRLFRARRELRDRLGAIGREAPRQKGQR